MTEFEHWLDEGSDADEFERSVLRSGLVADPPPGAEDAVWSSMLGTLVLASLPATASGANVATVKAAALAAGKGSAVFLGVGKGFVLGLAIYGAATGATG